MSLFGDKKLPTSTFKVPERPHHWVNSEGVELRLQVFVAVRDADHRVACVRLKNNPGQWYMPGESVLPNEDLNAAARRVTESYFGQALDGRIADIVTWPTDAEGAWYVLFLYEAHAPKTGLKKPEDTEEIAFAPPGKAPGEFALSHGDVFARLK